MNRCVVPISGGLDSSVILSYVKNVRKFDEIYCLTFNYGQRHDREITSARYQVDRLNADEHMIIDLNFLKSIATISSLTNKKIDVAKTKDVLGDPQTVNYVPFRNMLLLSVACAYAESVGANTVFHGAAQVDSQAGYWDGSEEFLTAINNLTDLNRRNRIKIEAPLLDKSKGEIIKLGDELGVDFSNTWTCYEGKTKACGRCTACSSRIKGFMDVGIKDPVSYEVEIPW